MQNLLAEVNLLLQTHITEGSQQSVVTTPWTPHKCLIPVCLLLQESSRRWQAKNCAGAKITNTAALLWSRQANLACCSRGWGFAQRRHLSGLHFAPNKPLVLRDRMHSRAYIGQYSGCGDLFVGARFELCYLLKL